MADAPLFLDLGDGFAPPAPKRPPAPKLAAPRADARPSQQLPLRPPPVAAPVYVPRPYEPYRPEPVVKSEVMKPHCPQCGAKRNIVIGGSGVGSSLEAWICSAHPHHCVQTWPVRLN